jgi:hypothetical protein
MSTGLSSTFADHVLRCASLRARLLTNEVLTMRIAVGTGLIDFDTALEHLADIGALHLIWASS